MAVHSFINRKAAIGAYLLSAAAALVFNTFPQVLSAIATQFEMGGAEVGSLISAYMGAFALVSLFAPLWTPRLPWKTTAVAAYLLIAVGVVMLDQVAKSQVAMAMFIIGLGSGILFAIAVGVLSAARDPDSAFGFMLTMQMVVGAVLVYGVANVMAGYFGYSGFVFGTLLIYLLTGIGIMWLPENFLSAAQQDFSNNGESGEETGSINFSAITATIAMFLFFGAYTGVWSFIISVGTAHGISESDINSVITFALLSGIGGALLCAWLGQRFGQCLPLITGMLVMIGSLLVLIYSGGTVFFAITVCTINAFLQFVVAYQMGLVTELDNNGRYTVLIPFSLSASAAIGGDLMGGFIDRYGLDAALLWPVIAMVIAMLMTLIVLKKGPEELAVIAIEAS